MKKNLSSLFGPFKLWDRKARPLSAQSEIVPGLFASQADRDIAILAVRALAAIGGPTEEPYLQKIKKNMTAHASVKKFAKDALTKLGKG